MDHSQTIGGDTAKLLEGYPPRFRHPWMQQQVSGMHIAHGLMLRRSQDFGLRGAKQQITCNDVIRNFRKKEFYEKDQKLWVWFGT